MIESILYLKEGSVENATSAQLDSLIENNKVFWIDVSDPTSQEIAVLAGKLSLHPLACEDSVNFKQRPKLEEYPNHLFLVVHGLTFEKNNIKTREMNLFLGKNFVISVHKESAPFIAALQDKLFKNPEPFKKGADMVLYEIIDVLRYFPVILSVY